MTSFHFEWLMVWRGDDFVWPCHVRASGSDKQRERRGGAGRGRGARKRREQGRLRGPGGGEGARIAEQVEARDPSGAGRGDARREALLLLSAMVGAVVMSRAAAGSPVSDEVLDVVRERLLARYP